MIESAELQSKSAKELNELAEKLPKDVAEYMRNLIGSLFNSKKKEKVVKKKDDQESRKGKRSKGKEKGKKKADEEAAAEENEETEEAKELTFFDYFKQVTDYGGPLFKSFDRISLFCVCENREAVEADAACKQSGASAEVGIGRAADCW